MNIFNSYEKRCSSKGFLDFLEFGLSSKKKNWPLLEGDFDFTLFSRDFDFFSHYKWPLLEGILKGSPGGGRGG